MRVCLSSGVSCIGFSSVRIDEIGRSATPHRARSSHATICSIAVMIRPASVRSVDMPIAVISGLRATLLSAFLPVKSTYARRAVFARSGFLEELGADKFSFTTHEAVQRALGESPPFDARVVQADDSSRSCPRDRCAGVDPRRDRRPPPDPWSPPGGQASDLGSLHQTVGCSDR